MRCRYAASCSYGARETATKVTSRAWRCTTFGSKLSAQKEQLLQPASSSGPNMKWYDELASSAEEIGQRLLSIRSLEDVFLLDALPRKLAPLPAEVVAQLRELLFLRQQRFARGDPLVVLDDVMLVQASSSDHR